MFDSILIRPNETRNHAVDVGQIIENLIFYQKTTLHAGAEEIGKLAELMDIDTVVELLNRPELSVEFFNSHCSVSQPPFIGIKDAYYVDTITVTNLDIEKTLYETYNKIKKDVVKSKEFAKRVSPLIPVRTIKKGFSENFNAELKDDNFRLKGIIENIKFYNPYTDVNFDELRFELNFLSGNIFKIESNIRFDKLHSISATGLVLNLICAIEDIQVMADYGSEISLPEINASMVRIKVNDILEKSSKSEKKIEAFNAYIYDESVNLREVINSGEKSVKDFIPLLDKAQKYKNWLADIPDNKNLLKEYINKVGEKSWMQSLQSKAVRFYFLASLGAILKGISPDIAALGSLGLSAFNTFIIEKLVKNWKPNQFIEKELVATVKK